MDTQIRRVMIDPVVILPPSRRTLSVPLRATPITDVSLPATTTSAERLREAILRCATEAQAEEKSDTDARLHCFVAKLSGCMETMGEVDMDHALWDLMKLRQEPVRRTHATVIDNSATEQIGGNYL
jgi:hypothetical protein